jgi:hypothetical protein
VRGLIHSACFSPDPKESLGFLNGSQITQGSFIMFKPEGTVKLVDKTVLSFRGNSPLWERLSSKIYLHSHLNISPSHASLLPNSFLILSHHTEDCLLKQDLHLFFFNIAQMRNFFICIALDALNSAIYS